MTPLVSVLITTFNRSHLLRRAIGQVLAQDFGDFEIVVIDDCSTDDTPQVMRELAADTRIRYFRNETNVGSVLGDRAHIRRFVYELALGRYFVYVCDDDYWLRPTLLGRQVTAHLENPNLVMAVGGQLSFYVGDDEIAPDITEANLHEYLAADYTAKSPRVNFRHGVFPSKQMSSDEYLEIFSNAPAGCNIIGGANLYNRDKFMQSGAIGTDVGSKWQAGFELVMGPGCYGDILYFDEPCIVTEIRQKNASFGRTQLEHYLDSIFSIELAFRKPIAEEKLRSRRRFLKDIRSKTILNLSRAYISNTLQIRRHGHLGLCTAENMSVPVTYRHMLPVFLRNGVWPTKLDLKAIALTALSSEQIKKWDKHRGR